MRRLLSLLTIALLLAGCSRRERLNPLDPGNPQTGGRPAGFNAIADYLSVHLVWTPQPDLDILGFQLFRLAPGDSAYRPLGGVLDRSSSSFLDAGTSNGQDYRYRLYFVLAGGDLGSRPAEDVATPGLVRPWVVDQGAGTLLRLSPDGRDVYATSPDLGAPPSLAVTPNAGPVWVSDRIGGRVWVLNPSDFSGPALSGFSTPFTIALDPLDGSAYICDLDGELRHVSTSGASLGTVSALDLPAGVAVSPTNRSVWVIENGASRVRRFAADGTALGAAPLPLPSRVAVDSLTRRAWVTSLDAARVWILDETLARVDSVAASGPIGLALDWRRRRAWIADAAAGRVLIVDMDTRAVLATIPGLGEPRDATVDLDTGDCWVVARTDHAVVRFAPDGTRLTTLAAFSDPYEVRLDPGRAGPAPQ